MRLAERVFNPSGVAIDKDAHVIRGVKILGRESRNGRVYTEQAMKDAVGLYEGCEVNIDHPAVEEATNERSMRDGIGRIVNARFEEDGVYGDLEYLETHDLASMLIERAERMPQSFGLSHNAEGSAKQEDDKLVVESLTEVYSVDVVRNPATNRGLFESEDKRMKTTVRRLLERHRRHPVAKQLLENLDEMPPEDMAAPLADAPVDDPAEAGADPEEGAEDQIKSAIKATVVAAVDDPNLDSKQTMDTIKKALKAQDDLVAAAAGKKPEASAPVSTEEEEDEDGESETVKKKKKKDDEDVAESIRTLRGRIDELLLENDRRRILDEAGIERLAPKAAAQYRECTSVRAMESFIAGLSPSDRLDLKPPVFPLAESNDDGKTYESLKEEVFRNRKTRR
jgi:hypothetical protein